MAHLPYYDAKLAKSHPDVKPRQVKTKELASGVPLIPIGFEFDTYSLNAPPNLRAMLDPYLLKFSRGEAFAQKCLSVTGKIEARMLHPQRLKLNDRVE